MKTSRRKFLQNASIISAGIAVGCNTKHKPTPVESCSPENYAPAFVSPPPVATISSVKNGDWSDVTVWGGRVPIATDTLSISHEIVYDMTTADVAGITINYGAWLSFSPSKTCTLQSSKNIIVNGILNMRPFAIGIGHTLRFINVNESAFIGGGMDVLDTDTGLWVMGDGKLDLEGAEKTAWSLASDSLAYGANKFSVTSNTGWNVGDEIVIAPTETPNESGTFLQGEERKIIAISGTEITINTPLAKAHPQASFNGQIRSAEVMNVTRNVRIEGTVTGSSHVFIRSTAKQTISYVQMRFMGPRKDTGGGSEKEFVPGRYGLHFHHCKEGSRGTVVLGCVVRETNSHSFVPHRSNGIAFKNCIAYKNKEAAFWVDEGEATHSITYDNCIAGDIGFVSRSMSFEDPTVPVTGINAFLLGVGDDCRCNNCVVWGQQGTPDDSAAFFWQANNEGVWQFVGNLAHNNMQGIWIWQNTTKNHIIDKFTAYNNVHGFLSGAYGNSYTFKECSFYANDIRFQANAAEAGLILINSYVDVTGLHDYAIDSRFGRVNSAYPIQIINCTLKGYKVAPLNDANGADEGAWIKKMYDMVNCNFIGLPLVAAGEVGEIVRVQNQNGDGQAYSISPGNIKRTIAKFAPDKYGSGTGLKGEYYNDSTFTNKVFERIDAPLAFQEWSYKPDPPGVAWIDYRITGNNHSMRWTGFIEAQYTETYTFTLAEGNLWIGGVLTKTVNMIAGQKYTVKIEYTNNDASSGVELLWQSKSQVKQYIPQSQLYPDGTIVVIPPDEPKTAIASAGPDVTITLPTNSVTLNGTVTNGTPVWSKVSGGAATITSPGTASTVITGLVAGTYVFRLTVGSVSDDVTVTVKAAVTSVTLTATATPNPTKSSWTVNVRSSNGQAINVKTTKSDGTTKENFGSIPSGTTGVIGGAYARGTYYLVLTQGTVTKKLQIVKQY